jgi:hypothetical protein
MTASDKLPLCCHHLHAQSRSNLPAHLGERDTNVHVLTDELNEYVQKRLMRHIMIMRLFFNQKD